MKTKYVITKKKVAILFSELIQHSEFKNDEPISAGFVSISADMENLNWATCKCYGESISLNLKSNPVEDEKIIKRQILGYEAYML